MWIAIDKTERMSDMANVIFRYSVTPCCGCDGDSDGGFSLSMTDSGDVEFIEYVFSKIESDRKHYALQPDTASEISRIISESSVRLDSIPHYLDNVSCCEDMYSVTFGSREYSGPDMCIYKISKLKKNRPAYYEANKAALEKKSFIAELICRIMSIVIDEIPEL